MLSKIGEKLQNINGVRQSEKDTVEKVDKAWYGSLPMLRLIMVLVHSDNIRSAYLKRNKISNQLIAIDKQKSVEKMATTVWEVE